MKKRCRKESRTESLFFEVLDLQNGAKICPKRKNKRYPRRVEEDTEKKGETK